MENRLLPNAFKSKQQNISPTSVIFQECDFPNSNLPFDCKNPVYLKDPLSFIGKFTGWFKKSLDFLFTNYLLIPNLTLSSGLIRLRNEIFHYNFLNHSKLMIRYLTFNSILRFDFKHYG
ncbi:MAG: hypothetical protein OXC61_04680 [Flavobacteriaceae bacterium]|nr:hypothetical protein [Flavobacteriaceae bacterium]